MPFSRPLRTAAQKDAEAAIEQAARAFVAALHLIGGTDPKLGRLASADLTLAMRHIEDAEFRALRHVAGAAHS